MKFTKQDLLTLLIGLFLFTSCKNPSGVGLDVDPGTAITGTLVNTEKISTTTVRESVISTSRLTRHPLGYMVDPVFGKTESSLAMTVWPSVTSYDFGTTPTLDSAILVLNLGTQFYGDTTNSKYSINVYQLTNPIVNTKSDDVQAHNTRLLGTFNSKIYPNTPIKVMDIVVGGKDTLRTQKAQIRIPLDKGFIQTNILNLGTTGTSSNAKFVESFKGLYAEVNKTVSTGVGGIAFIDFASTNSYLQLVYKKAKTTSGVDTTSVNFPINNSSGLISANIKHDYTGTPVETQLANQATQYDVTYNQGLLGVKTKISFPDLTKFNATYGKAIVNKAELVVSLSAGTFTYPFSAAQRLSLYRWDIAEQPANISDFTKYSTGNPAIFGGYFDSINNRYVFLVTSYVQELIDGKVIDYGTFIAPTSLSEFQITPSATAAARSVIGSFGNTTNKVKLNIYYTKIN